MNDLEKEFISSIKALLKRYDVVINDKLDYEVKGDIWVFSNHIFTDPEKIIDLQLNELLDALVEE